MRRLLALYRASVIAVLASWFAASYAAASHPDILRNYRFIPSHSTLEVTGGIAGIQEMLQVSGTFGLITGFREGVSCAAIGCPPPSHVPYAEFTDVVAELEPGIFASDLDKTLKLSGLDGTFQDPNHLFFSGTEGQDFPFRLEARIRGPLIQLIGANEPGCCDFYEYRFKALAYLRPNADFNLDGVVDTSDYLVWRRTLGETGAGASADADGNDAVDTGDYDFWRSQFGEEFDFSVFDGPDVASSATPEPATILLVLVAATLLPMWPTRRR